MRRVMRFERLISIILIAALLMQCAAPLFARAAYAADNDDSDWETQLRKDFEKIYRDQYQNELRNKYSQQMYGVDYVLLFDADRRMRVDSLVNQEIQRMVDDRINQIKKDMEDLEDDNPYKKPSDESNEDEYRDNANDAYDESDLKDIFDSLIDNPDAIPDLLKKIVNNLTGLPISELIDLLQNQDPDGLITYLTTKLMDKLFDKLDNQIVKYLADLIQIIVNTEILRLIHWTCAQPVEIGVIFAAGAVMVVACIPAIILAKSVAENVKAVIILEGVALAGIAVLDVVLRFTTEDIRNLYKDWYDEIRADYDNDHKSLPGGTFRDGMRDKLMGMRLSLSLAGVSYPLGDISPKFEEVNPGYRSASADIYINDYKKIAGNWRQYVTSHAGAAKTERDDFATLEKTITDLADDSFDKAKGYTQAIEARAQTYAFAAQQTTNLRHDIARQVDIRARVALDRQQRRADLHSAFGRAAKGGAPWPAGTGY